MSIAQQLPFEILELTFTYSWRIKSSGKWAAVDRTDIPILLLHVCSSWRKATLSTSILWSNLSLTFGDSIGDLMSFEDILDRSEILDPWIELVGRGPKCLRLAFNWDNGPVYDFVPPETSCQDVKHLVLVRSPPIADLVPEGSSLPRLETLVIFYGPGVEVPLNDRKHDLPPHSTYQLRKLWLHGVDSISFLLQSQSWTQLTHLVLEERVASLSPILRSCPQLEEAVIFLKYDPSASALGIDGLGSNSKLSTPAAHRHCTLAKLVIYTFFSSWPVFPDIADYFLEWHLPALISFQLTTSMQAHKIFRGWSGLMERMPLLQEVYLGPGLYYSRVDEEEMYDAFNRFNPFLHTLILDQSDDMISTLDPYAAADYRYPFSNVDALRRFILTRTRKTHRTLEGALLVPIKKLVFLLSDEEEVIDISRSLLQSVKTNLDPFLLLAGHGDGNERDGSGGGLQLEVSMTSTPHRTLISNPPHSWYYGTSQQKERHLEQLMKDYSTYRAFSVE